MKSRILLVIWMIALIILLIGLLIWGVWYVDKIDNQISIFGIVAIITAAMTSVITVSINNREAKKREYEIHVLKEKQMVYEHFYNTFFYLLENTKKGGSGLPKKAEAEMMLFKKGLMNWGSERLIKEYIIYDNKLAQGDQSFDMLHDGNKFLKEIRKDMGFDDSTNLNLMSIILLSEDRIKIFGDKQ